MKVVADAALRNAFTLHSFQLQALFQSPSAGRPDQQNRAASDAQGSTTPRRANAANNSDTA
jgi:hypothetical protein